MPTFPRCLLPLLMLAPLGGCHRPPSPGDVEKKALDELAVYEPDFKLDDKGRVIELRLEGRHVDDDALDQIEHFPQLHHLSLRDASVSDAGIIKLRELKRLDGLGITDTRVTDHGLAALQHNVSLRWVWVTENQNLTHAGVEAFRKAMPGVQVFVMNRREDKKAKTPEKK